MKNGIAENVMRKVKDNLPTIFTGASIVAGVSTIGYSVFAGWKIKETVDNKELDKKEKTKKIVKVSIPTVAGTVITVVCNVASHKEHMRKYAGAMALYGLTKVDSEEFKEEMRKIVGKEKVEEVERDIRSQKIVEPNVPANCNVRIRDDVTGYSFETTMNDFWNAVNTINEYAQSDETSIAQFYEELLGKSYEFADIHERITFGYEGSVGSFRPSFAAAMTDDMKLIYTITYPYNEAH